MGKSKRKTFKVLLAALMSISSLGITPVVAEDYGSEVNFEEIEPDASIEGIETEANVTVIETEASIEKIEAEDAKTTTPEVVDKNVTYAETITEFADAIYTAPDETDAQIMLPSSVDVAEILSDTTYSEITYDDISVLKFDTVEEKELATAKLEEAVGGENIAKNEVVFHLDSNEDFSSEADLSSEEPTETEVVSVEKTTEEEPKAIVEVVSPEEQYEEEAELVEEAPKVEEEPKEILENEEPKVIPVSNLMERAEPLKTFTVTVPRWPRSFVKRPEMMF